MRKLCLLLSILFFIYWGCEEQDSTPPTVSISSHSSGQSVNEIVTITVTTQDNEGIDRVEFYIDDSLFFTDTESPYQYDWNTTQYDDNSEHIVKVISYDNSDNSTESQPIMLIVDNRVYLWGEYYPLNTTYLYLRDSGITGSIPPEIGNLTNLTYLYLGVNNLTGSIPPEIGNLTNLTYLNLQLNQLTGSIPPEIGILINLESMSISWNQLSGSIPPEIGNLTNLTYLDLRNNQLTGSIPPEIGNLTNLIYLSLYYNQLTGEIPESICDLNINWSSSSYFSISNNQLCPPYPYCIEEYVGEQDTSDCP